MSFRVYGEIFYGVRVVEEIKNMETHSSFLQSINLSGIGSYSQRQIAACRC